MHHADRLVSCFEGCYTSDEVSEVGRWKYKTEDATHDAGLLDKHRWQNSADQRNDNHDRATQLGFLEERGPEKRKSSQGKPRENDEPHWQAFGAHGKDEDGDDDTD